MARIAHVVVFGIPHHVTQRGNRRTAIFGEPSDYLLYRDLLAERLARHRVVCWAYGLMPNHVHLILAPPEGDASLAGAALSRAVGEAHRRYTAFVNARARVTGHLFQGRVGYVAMDEAHVIAALRYLAFNPVRAGLASSRKTGLGAARGPISQERATGWRARPRRWNSSLGSAASLICRWRNRRLSTHSKQKARTAVRWAMASSSRR
jgi:REP element-mobilizing transposase RayT